MKKDKAVSFLWSWLISFFMSLSAVMWLVTAFGLGVDKPLLTVFCVIVSFVCSLCYALPLGFVPVGIGALVLGYLWRSGTLELSVEALLNRLTRQYNKAYNWGIIRWGLRTADEMEPSMITILCILAALVAMATAWALCRRKSTVWPVLSILFVGGCFVVNDTVPDTIWIYILLVCVVTLLLTSPVRKQDEKRANRLLLWVMPVAVVGMLMLFLATPRESYQKQPLAEKLSDAILGEESMELLMGSMENLGNAAGISDPNRVDLSSVGYRTESEATVMTVTAVVSETMYLRGRAMDYYDGTGWTNTRNGDLPWPSEELRNAGEVEISTRFAHRMLYIPYYTNYGEGRDLSFGAENEKNLTQYSFSYRKVPGNLTPETIAKDGTTVTPAMLQSAIQMAPEVKVWATALATKITDGTDDFGEKAQRIASYVRNSAAYNLYTPRMPEKEKDFARWFLERSDRGYCVHFATATTVLLQAAGVPARYVTGYLVQTTAYEPVKVQSKQAHAWTEYYLPNCGWVVLESTPPSEYIPQLGPAQTVPVTTQPSEIQTAPTEPEQTLSPTEPEVQMQTQRDLPAILWVVPVLTLLVAALPVQSRLRLRRRRKREQQAEANARALMYWQETVQLAKLSGQLPPKALLQLAEKAKFSSHILTQEELRQFTDFRESAVALLKKRDLFRKVYYRLILAIY